MAVARALRRLLRVLTLEEEQAQAALEAALAHLPQLEQRLNSAIECERAGRRLIVASAHSGNAIDRAAGLEEIAAGRSAAVRWRSRVTQAQQQAAERRTELLAKRVEQRQADTLIRAAQIRETLEAARRTQQSSDDWYLGRLQRALSGDETRHESKPGIESARAAKLE